MLSHQYAQQQRQGGFGSSGEAGAQSCGILWGYSKAGLEHEIYVTSLIHNLYDAAQQSKDFRTLQFLDWFVKEQGEAREERRGSHSKDGTFSDREAKGLYMLNSELAARVYTAPSLVL